MKTSFVSFKGKTELFHPEYGFNRNKGKIMKIFITQC